MRIGLLGGCVGEGLESRAQATAEALLRAAGHQVLRPAGQACCGALDQHAGLGLHAGAQRDRNRALWSAEQPDCLVATASGCQAAFAAGLDEVAPVRGIAGLLAADPGFAALALRAVDRTVALHLPCTQLGLPGEADATRALLARVPGLRWVELPDAGCCGAAGAHMLAFPQRAATLRAPLVDAVVASGATTLASANIGCRLHLGGAAELVGVELLHPLELLAEALP
jgi:glycolate oxidase iron-sulfur subunit